MNNYIKFFKWCDINNNYIFNFNKERKKYRHVYRFNYRKP